MKRILLIVLCAFLFVTLNSYGQSVPFPSQNPPWNQIGDWGHANGPSWELEFLPFKYNTLPFRLMPPNGVSYTKGTNGATYGSWTFPAGNQKYPLIVFLHGFGEKGTNNRSQLIHGARTHYNAVKDGTFPGYLLYAQTENGFWSGGNNLFTKDIIEHLIANNNVDPNRIYVHGLSAGGTGTWQIIVDYPKLFAAALPMSASGPVAFIQHVPKVVEIPIWASQGGLDKNPSPPSTQQLVDAFTNAGGNLKLSYYPDLGHGTWNRMYGESDFFPFMLRNKKNQIHVFGGKTNFCAGENISAKLGITAGFDGYEWRRNGVVFASNVNQVTVTTAGSYTMRFRRGAVWTEWSDPVIIQYVDPTPAPVVKASGSVHFPTLDGKTSVTLSVPSGYKAYQWSTGATTESITVSSPGNYSIAVTEFNGCPGNFSNPFVVTLNSNNGPAAPSAISAIASSETNISLTWDNSGSNITGFELYKAANENGPYHLVDIFDKAISSYNDENLATNTTFYYQLRSFNNLGASPYVAAVATTFKDVEPPTVPTEFKITSNSETSVSLSWISSVDNVDGLGALVYDLYYNGTVKEINASNSSPFPENLALNKPAFASSIENASRNADKAVDGDINSFWSSGTNDTEWMYVDLGKRYNVQGISLRWSTGNNFAIDFKIQVSDDAVNWTDIKVVEDNVTRILNWNDLEGTGRYVRLYNTFRNSTRYAVHEFEVYGNQADGKGQPLIETTIKGLTPKTVYTFTLQARDRAGNSSASTNQISTATINEGLTYKYYEQGSLTSVDQLPALIVRKTGTLNNFSLTPRNRNNDFGFIFDGYINIPANGLYTFYTSSDDGSKLSIGNLVVVDNDGVVSSTRERSGQIILNQGTYPIKVSYFKRGSDNLTLNVRWEGPGITKQLIPNGVLNTTYTAPAKPAAPSNIVATAVDYQQINLSWQDNSSNESGFEIYRSTSHDGPFALLTTTAANATSYQDKGLTASTQYFYQIRSVGATGESDFVNFQVTGTGLEYKYYTGTQANLNVPFFAGKPVIKSGNVPNVTLAPRTQETNFGFVFTGYIDIPTTGTYTFFTRSDDGSRLFIGETAVVNNDFNQSMTERSGTIALTAGNYPITIAFRQATGGYGLEVRYSGPGISKQLIPDAAFREITYFSATTLPLPPAPAIPQNITVNAQSPSNILISWANVTNATGVNLFRSSAINGTYSKVHTSSLPATSYLETELSPNTTYYYKLSSVGPGGESVLTSSFEVKTLNNAPTINPIADFTIRYDESIEVSIEANDLDGDNIQFSATNLPSFITLIDNGNGTAKLVTNPSIGNIGTYPNISIIAQDGHGGSGSTTFSVIVNSNYKPVLTEIGDVFISEGESLSIELSASDQNGDALTFSLTGPSFVSLTDNGNGTALMSLSPGYEDSGTHTVTIKVNDGQGGEASQSLSIYVSDVETDFRVSVNFNQSVHGSIPWNNTAKAPAINDKFSNLKNHLNLGSGINLTLLTAWGGLFNAGATTGNNSGVVPDNVMKEYYYFGIFGGPNLVRVKVDGLDQNFTYDFTFFASSTWTGTPNNGETNYTINGQTVSVNVQNNTSRTATISGISPNANGEVFIDMTKGTGASAGYINALIIDAFRKGNPPVAPTDLAGEVISGSQIDLVWKDNSSTETGFQIHRTTASNPEPVIMNVGPNIESYSDVNGLKGNTTYTYRVRAINRNGSSGFTEAITLTTPNAAPVINTALTTVNVVVNTPQTINIESVDNEGDVITLSASGLPGFATFTDNGNGNGSLIINPSSSDLGRYLGCTITATDNYGNASSKTFEIFVGKERKVVYINFTDNNDAGAPWNNLSQITFYNTTYPNLKDDEGNGSGISIKLVDSWLVHKGGAGTGSNSGLYPDAVMEYYYYTAKGTPKRFLLSGLKQELTYDLSFFGSSIFPGINGETNYTVNGKTVSLDVQSNVNSTVQIGGLKPNANGEILLTIDGGLNATYGFINALTIDAYVDNGTPAVPGNLRATAKSKRSIELQWTGKGHNETGFEIYRANQVYGTFTLIHTTPANVYSYTDLNLSENHTYYYKVKAKNGALSSEFSKEVICTTLKFLVYVNFNSGNNESSPWNNLNRFPAAGSVMSNLRNELWAVSGINLTLETNWDGTNPYGTTTGNNSGVFPDRVMQRFYFLELGTKATLKIDGLQQGMAYNFVFFGASTYGTNNGDTKYTINGQSVLLNVQNNTTKTAQINRVVPDANGAVFIDIIGATGARYGYLNAMVIEAYNVIIDGTNLRTASGSETDETTDLFEKDNQLAIYPNPFDNLFKIKYPPSLKGKVNIQILDQLGNKIYDAETVVDEFERVFEIDLAGKGLRRGLYIIKIKSEDSSESIHKLIKN